MLVLGLFHQTTLRYTSSTGPSTEVSRAYDIITRQSSGNLNQLNGEHFIWKTIYDSLGRLIQTTSGGSTINYYYDPEVEFLELGHEVNGSCTWNLYGPDRSGTYGGAGGIGGLESGYQEATGFAYNTINNYFGDIVGIVAPTYHNPAPYPGVVGGYGPMPGSDVNHDLEPQWRGHYLDITGFYYMGTRYYDPINAHFLSPDPLGHSSSLGLYDYCNGDPVNGLDPDGRCVESTLNVVPGQAAWQQTLSSLGNGNYGDASLSFGIMLSEQTLAVATLGMGSAASVGGEVASSFTAEGAPIEDTIFTNWNEFQTGTRGQFASRAEAGTAWNNYKQGMAAEIENIKGSKISLIKG